MVPPADQAAKAAADVAFPVALKLAAVGIIDKSDVGGVRLNLELEEGSSVHSMNWRQPPRIRE